MANTQTAKDLEFASAAPIRETDMQPNWAAISSSIYANTPARIPRPPPSGASASASCWVGS